MTAQSSFSRSFLLRYLRTTYLPFAVVAATGCGTGEALMEPAASERTLEVVEYGAGDTTVVFESGLGSDWTPWESVAREVSNHARTFAYSRPGYGKSDPSPEPRDATQIVEDLRTLLMSRSLAPPYLLVGHSLGGTYMELFAKAYPQEVLGLVLVDPRHRDFTRACEAARFEGCSVPASIVATLPQVQIDELEAFEQTSHAIQSLGGFGAYPVRILTATSHDFTPDVEALWESMLGSLADEAADGIQSIFVGSGHYLQLEEVQAVTEVILSLLPDSRR